MPQTNREQYQRIRAIFDEVCDCPREERAACLDSLCGDDPDLRTDVEALLAHYDTPGIDFDEVGSGLCELLSSAANESSHARSPALPECIGPYRILRLLGEGGMGVVYLAEQDRPKRTVALKIIRPGFATPGLLRRFEYEAHVLGRLQHSGIAQIHSAGMADTSFGSQPYLVMEYIDGHGLLQYSQMNALSTQKRLELFMGICDAVQHAHQRGIIHRDLKPANILVDTADQPKVLDFGVARATDPELQVTTIAASGGQIIGTLPYMSPEQVGGEADDVDTRSDVYALGVILFELLSGRLPYDFSRKSVPEMTHVIREQEPDRLGTLDRRWQGDIETIVAKALQKEKSRRYQTVRELRQDISRHLNNEAILARPASGLYSLGKFVRRHRAAVLGGSLVAATLVLATIISISFSIAASEQRRIAERNEQIALAEAQRAEREAERAQAAESEATQRADELELVAAFQESQLSRVNPVRMGERLRESIIDQHRDALRDRGERDDEADAFLDELVRSLAAVNFTDVALEAIDKKILVQAYEAINQQFADQPQVQGRLLSVLATTARRLGLLERAVVAQQRALDIRREVLGNDHPDTIRSVLNMGNALQSQGRTEEAEPYYREALASSRRVLGSDHSLTLDATHSMVTLEYSLGDIAAAESYMREALAGFQRTAGDDAETTLAALNSVGAILALQGKLEEAEPFLREAVERYRRVYGENHPHTMGTIGNFGALLRKQGKLAEAEQYYAAALEGSRRVLGSNHPDTLTSISNMAFLLRSQGKMSKAEPLHRESLDRRLSTLGINHPDTLVANTGLATLLAETDRHQEALDLLEPVHSTAREVLVAGYAVHLGEYLIALGSAHAGLRNFAIAETTLIEAHMLLSDILHSHDSRLSYCAAQLAQLYDAWHDAEPGNGYDVMAKEWKADAPSSDPALDTTDS